MEEYIDELLKNYTKDELVLIKEKLSNMSMETLLDKVDNAISYRQDIMDNNCNKHINLMEVYSIPDNVKVFLLENDIVTMADLEESGIKDSNKTDHWIEWIKTYLDMNKVFNNKNKKIK